MKKQRFVSTFLVLFLLQVQPISAASLLDDLPGNMVQPTVLFGLFVILIGALVLGLSVAVLNHRHKV